MLDIRLIRETPEIIEASLRRRGSNADIGAVVELDERRRALVTQAEELRQERNSASKEIGAAKQRGEDAEPAMAAVRELGDRLSALDEQLKIVDRELEAALVALPNLVADDVPDGGEDEGTELRRVGSPLVVEGGTTDHLDLGIALDVIDMERGARTSGSRFAYLKGDAARLQFALTQFALDRLGSHGFLPVVPPVLVREEAMWGTGFFPADASQIYRIPEENHDLLLVGTSEVPLAALHMNEILDAEALPLRYAGVSSCFRREAGAAGKDTRGLIRVHQFDKIEMFSFVEAHTSAQEHDFILAREEELISALELPYRVVNIAAGDLGAPATKKYDIEVWFPGQQRYRELTSCSNTLDYQARRLKARVRREKGTEFVHTLNGTAFAIGRTIAALFENHQLEDGTIRVPEALHEYGAPKIVRNSRMCVPV
ncbi:MAG: serS [Thermoleophilia bacterium]|nr:serS [Thermoleophilia bacterium]